MKRWKMRGAPDTAQIDEIASVIRDGGIVLMPTDTIYGLHALPANAARVADLKGRDESKSFVIIAASIGQVGSIGADVPPALCDIWPAPLTAVLRRGGETVAVRVPNVVWLRELLARTGALISTSANRSGEAPITDPSALDPDLAAALDGIVDAGVREGKASTIVDFTGSEPRFIREGDPAFSRELRKQLLRRE